MITKLDYNLDIKQNQQLVMTSELRQAIELLQYSSLELNEFINKELLDNPILELDDNYTASTPISSSQEINYENFVSKELSLQEHITNEFYLVATDKLEKKIGKYIIGNLDQSGFFQNINSVAQEQGVSKSKVEKVLEKIKFLEPIGVASSGIKEFLLLQLEVFKEFDYEKVNLAQKIVNNYLDELAKNQLKKIGKELKINVSYVQKLVDLIRSLKSTPAENFVDKLENKYVKADITIKKVNTRYEIIMDKSSFPTLRINSYYKKLLSKDKEEGKEYIEERLNSALWLIKSIEQRRATIRKIIKDIINYQYEFLEYGLKYLRPMTMKEVANRIEVHESTVSRATSNKYIQTPYGLFKFKFFFSEAVKGQQGEVSAIAAKEELKGIIAQEDKSRPLSDQKISSKLKKLGIYISRRTIAKYRSELMIPSSRLRRRYD